MRTRNAKRLPSGWKAATKTLPSRPELAAESASPASSARVKRSKGKLAKENEEITPTSNTSSDFKPEQSPAEDAKVSGDASPVIPETKVATAAKSVRRTPKAKTPISRQTAKSMEDVEAKESSKEEEVADAKNVEIEKMEEPVSVGETAEKEQDDMEVEGSVAASVESVDKQQTTVGNVEDPLKELDVNFIGERDNKEDNKMEVEASTTESTADSSKQEKPFIAEVAKSQENELCGGKEVEEATKKQEEEMENIELEEDPEEVEDDVHDTENKIEQVNLMENIKEQLQEDAQPEKEEGAGDEGMDEYVDRVDFGEHGEEEPATDYVEEPEETEALEEEENRELSAIAKERKIKKEHEIFVGGLDRDATEEDVKKVFEKIGEIVEVRLHKNFSTNKNKGYAFVKFANKEHAKQALSEMKNPIICGKQCGTAPSEDNDALFLGNICNTWTKEAIKQKFKDYGIESVESITLVPDVQREGLSRGFAFLEFSCHADAMLAYKRLQKPDAIFGHPERTAKVAFAEPLREPDPEIMAQVKSVFMDGLPPHWDEDHVREQFKGYGEIVKIVLARNMSTARRKDYGFVDFSSHEAAVACIDSINSLKSGDGKTKVKARLSNPLPKTQAVKGGMCGGFRIGGGGGGSGGTFPKFGRGFGRGGHSANRPNFQRGRGFYQAGQGQTGRMGFPSEYGFDNPYADFHGRQNFGGGGRRGFFRGGQYASSRGAGAPTSSSRPNIDRPWHDVPDRDHGRHIPVRRQPFSPERRFDRPYTGRHFDDPYLFEDSAPGMKRPFYMTDHDPGYMEPGRVRPRFDYSDPAVPFRGTRYRDSFGAGSSMYPHDYYGSDYAGGHEGYGGGPHPSYFGGDRPYGGDHPYRGDRLYRADRLYGGDRPFGGDRPYGGGYYY